jgi:outer membrane protein assembly factor BamB
MTSLNLIFIGIKGSAMALDQASGIPVWERNLKGSDFVNLTLSENELYAATHGEIYCLDPATGKIRWHNELKGMGYGLVSIAVSGSQSNATAMAKHIKDQEEASVVTGTVIAASS